MAPISTSNGVKDPVEDFWIPHHQSNWKFLSFHLKRFRRNGKRKIALRYEKIELNKSLRLEKGRVRGRWAKNVLGINACDSVCK